MNHDQRVDAIRQVLDQHLEQLDDIQDVDTDDLAENIANYLERKEQEA